MKNYSQIPRRTCTEHSAAAIDATSMPMHIEQVLSRICVRVRPYPRRGSDRLPYIQQRAYCEAEEVGPNVIIGNS